MAEPRIVQLLQEIDPQRILIIKPSALGDVIQSLPLLSVLRDKYPSTQIDWVIRSELAELLQTHPDLHDLHLYYRKGGWKESLALLQALRKRKYDLVFDLQGLLRTGFMTAATRGRLRIGLETARECSGWTCHGLLPGTSKQVPANRRYWRIAELLGYDSAPKVLNLGITAEEKQSAQALIEDLRGPTMVIHPGAMWVTKRWPVNSFAQMAKRVIHQYGMSVAVVGTKGERADAEAICEIVKNSSRKFPIKNLAGQTSLRELAGLLEAAPLLLTNDSGPMHLAAGLGTPVVGIFTCTSAERSGPAGDRHELIQAMVPCAASYRKECPFSGSQKMQCMSAVSPHQVWTAIQSSIEKNAICSRVA